MSGRVRDYARALLQMLADIAGPVTVCAVLSGHYGPRYAVAWLAAAAGFGFGLIGSWAALKGVDAGAQHRRT
jgi:hypothetical protein